MRPGITYMFLLFLLIPSSGFAQVNLIVNGGFELFDTCEYSSVNIHSVHNWNSANQASPDYFNTCNWGDVGVPNNFQGMQPAKEGNGYAGMLLIMPIATNNYIPYREAIQGVLTQRLEYGGYYCFEMSISVSDFSAYVANEIDVYFSADTIVSSQFAYDNISLPNQMEFSTWDMRDTNEWYILKGKYLAEGGEKHIVISWFPEYVTLQKFKPGGSDSAVYYYVDDLKLYQCPPFDPEIPNVFTPDDNGINEIFYIHNLPDSSRLQVYNRWGNTVYESSYYRNDWDGKTLTNEKVREGTYFYVLQTPDRKKYTGTLNVFDVH